MKSLVIFYTGCVMVLYTMVTFIGYRHKTLGNIKNGLLAEVVVTASKSNTKESNILAGHFNRAKNYLEAKNEKRAGKEVYDALMILAMRTVSTGDHYDKILFHSVINDLKNCYLGLETNKPVTMGRLNLVFERSELFIAQTCILRSERDVEKNNLVKALKDINQAEEGIVLAYKYAGKKDKELDKKIFNGSRHYLNDVIIEMNGGKSVNWKKMKQKLTNVDGKLEGSVTQ